MKNALILQKLSVPVTILDDFENVVFEGTIKEPTAKRLDEYQSMVDELRKLLYSKLLKISLMKEKNDKFEAESHTVDEKILFNDSMEKEAETLNAKELGDNKKIVEFILCTEILDDIWDENFSPSVREGIINKFREIANLDEMEKNLETLLPIIKT
jgi:hypothetical protein